MFLVGIEGTVQPSSSSERALRSAMSAAEELGAWSRVFPGDFMRSLPMYDPVSLERSREAHELVAALRAADGVIISSAAYHGSVSGLLKNALDYVEDLADDERPYLSGRPVGLICVAAGWQGGVNNLGTLRTIVHSLRAWPSPYGCVINTDRGTTPGDPVANRRTDLALVAAEVVSAAGRLSPGPVVATRAC